MTISLTGRVSCIECTAVDGMHCLLSDAHLISCAFSSLSSPAGTVLGPSGTPYEGGVFQVDILIPVNYPFEPPKMRFDTKVWHPNVSSQNGAICLDILKNEWSVERERKKAKK